MAPPPIAIIFHQQHTPYLPGATVTGTVLIRNSKPLSARSVTIHWKGISKTWGFGFSDLKGRECHFHGSQTIWKSGGDGKTKMPAGLHETPFEFELPDYCPPSFQGQNGKTVYKVTVEVDSPWSCNIKVDREFLVTRKLTVPEAQHFGVSATLREVLRSGKYFHRGNVFLTIDAPKTLFYPGQIIPLDFSIINDSTRTITKIFASLHQSCHYHAAHLNTPCPGYSNEPCPLSRRHQFHKVRRIGKVAIIYVDVAPMTTKTYTMAFKVQDGQLGPGFESGLMTMGYFMQCGVVVGRFFKNSMIFPVYID